jgi:hypothetical protein
MTGRRFQDGKFNRIGVTRRSSRECVSSWSRNYAGQCFNRRKKILALAGFDPGAPRMRSCDATDELLVLSNVSEGLNHIGEKKPYHAAQLTPTHT